MSDRDSSELDRFLDARHPRDAQRLFGHREAESQFLKAYQSGRMPHAWLLAGPEGIGKASFAWRAARFILENPDFQTDRVNEASTLDSDFLSPTGRRISAMSHGSLISVRREIDAGKKSVPTEIRVDQIRHMIEFFGSTASEDGWRIAIVDPLDELNRSGANALLKLVEEPPQRALILMVTHAIGRLLPTIRSRCRVLHFRPLSQSNLISALMDQPAPPDRLDAEAAAVDANGSVREALKRVDPTRRLLIAKVIALIEKFPEIDRGALFDLTETLNSRNSTPDYEAVIETIRDHIETECKRRAGEGAVRLAPLIEVWEKSQEGMSVVDRYNLDRRPFLLSLFSDLADVQRPSVIS